jgi:hypothetical protein
MVRSLDDKQKGFGRRMLRSMDDKLIGFGKEC